MKKIILVSLILLISLNFASCGGKKAVVNDKASTPKEIVKEEVKILKLAWPE